MESSEDDAGTATNASRRASAREKDVGLAEDVNATSSLQQKPSEARSSCQTPAMSEDNFDGDSVPSPSSQDVNTSTEAILDMIDEIVDGPGAPKRLSLASDLVDALNEELAATSYNLNIIQESVKSDSENISLTPEVASSVNNADSEVVRVASVDKPAEYSPPGGLPTDNVKTDSADLLPASSSVAESEEKAESTEPEHSVVLNVETETSTTCPPPNIPSSSEEQTVQNVSDTSVCETQDRTVKCVTSSDSRDNVTVESAESTSSDSSVSESKTLLVEPQSRSPQRRKLVRPAPSDRRPDSTVSSTVDSQIVNVPAAEQTSSEITKDVTSSSDAVPTIHGNVKPEEIRNVSEINFCKAETSVSPPKKIKLIRQKNITGTSNREIPVSQVSVLAEKEQCQSTSSDNHSVNLSIPATESMSADRLSQSEDDTKTISSDNSNCVSEKLPELPVESSKEIISDEHSLPSTEAHCSPHRDDSACLPEKSSSCAPHMQESADAGVNKCTTEQETCMLPTSNSSELTTNLKVNDIEQGNICNTYDSDLKSVDYIPLHLPPQSKKQQLNKSMFDSNSHELDSINSALQSRNSKLDSLSSQLSSKTSEQIKICEPGLTSSEQESKITEVQSSNSELQTKSLELESKLSVHPSVNAEVETKANALESTIKVLQSSSCDPESKSSVLETASSGTNSTQIDVQLSSSELQSKHQTLSNDVPSSNTESQSQITQHESMKTDDECSSSDIKASNTGQQSTSFVPVSMDSELVSISSEVEAKSSEVEAKSSDVEAKSCETDLKSSEVESKGSKVKSTSSEVKSTSSEIESKSSELEPMSLEIDSKSQEVESKSQEIESKSQKIESKSQEVESKSQEVESKGEEVESKNQDVESKSNVVESKSIDVEVQNSVVESKGSEVISKSSDVESMSSDIQVSNSEIQTKSSEPEAGNSNSKPDQTELLSNIPDIEMKTTEIPPNTEIPVNSTESELPNKFEMTSTEVESKRIELVSGSNERESKSNEIDLKHTELHHRSSEVQSSSHDIGLNSLKSEPPKRELELINTEKESTQVVVEENNSECVSTSVLSVNCQPDHSNEQHQDDQKKVPPIKLNLRSSMSNISESKLEIDHSSINKNSAAHEESDCNKQVPKLTIKLKQPEEMKSPVPKVTIKPIRPPVEEMVDKIDDSQVPCVTKINIKPIVKPLESDKIIKPQTEDSKETKLGVPEQLPSITKLNIKPIIKPPEKINDIHRKSSSSEISESECSENDETTSTSDQASASDHGSSDVIPKVTIKLGKPGTESEGQFYTEKNVPKLTIKGIQQDEKLIISQSDESQPEKIPKLTIKTVTKTESQPLSPKLTIKPLKPPDSTAKEGEILKLKISTESFSPTEGRESPHVPKITIKPVTRMDDEPRTPKKTAAMCDSPEHIPVVTKLNIKPILKPTDSGDSSESFDEKVPVVSKLNIKPVIKPKDNDIESSVDDVPKITKLNIKPLKNPEENSSENFKDCDELNADIDENSIPVVTKINIKPIIKPQEEEKEKESENVSSETGNSSDDNTDHIPVVTKLNIKPIVKPDEMQESSKPVLVSEQTIPIVTKLNIKPLVKPGQSSPSSPKKENKIDVHSTTIPVVTKLNIKPVVRPEEMEAPKSKDDNDDKSAKNPPLVMKINMKSVTENFNHETSHNEDDDGSLNKSQKSTKIPNELEKPVENKEDKSSELESVNDLVETRMSRVPAERSLKQNCVPDSIQKNEENAERTSIIKNTSLNVSITTPKPSEAVIEKQHSPKLTIRKYDTIQKGSPPLHDSNKEGKIVLPNETHTNQGHKNISRSVETAESNVKQMFARQKMSSVQNCTLLKKLLENTRDSLDKNLEVSQVANCTLPSDRSESTISACKNIVNSEHLVESGKSGSDRIITRNVEDNLREKEIERRSATPDKFNDLNKSDPGKLRSLQELSEKVNENVTKPLEIAISDKLTNQSSGQDSPRIILKINKTDHGPSAKIITEDVKRPDAIQNYLENTQDNVNDKQSPKRHIANSRRKQAADTDLNLSSGKRLRSSRIVENTEKSQVKRNVGKRPSTTDSNTPQNKEPELTTLQSKRLKLGQLLSGNKTLNVTPSQTSPTKTSLDTKPGAKPVNHALLNNENCSKNGNSKLHNILSNLQAKQMQSLPFNNTNCSEKPSNVPSDIECNASMSSSEAVDLTHVENSHPELQQMIINENSDFRDLTGPEDTSQDPLEVDNLKPTEVPPEVVIDIPKPVELTPQPKKRGRPRKLPVSEGAKPPVAVALPVPALEERPQRSLRLMRDRPAILQKPRGGRGRGRGGRRPEATPPAEPETVTIIEPAVEEPAEERPAPEIDPTSSRIKLPRMTEALDKMPSMCTTPLSSRRRNSSGTFSAGDTPELKAMLDNTPPKDEFPNTPEPSGSRGRGGRGSRGGRGRTPRGRGRGRGGGRGAMYMKETLGIYGRVCGPATTTVQLFEEETCMMDDNATPAKPSHLLDEDSQSSVKSLTNESSKMKKSKFADLFDSNKVWTAADVKEYTWPPPEKGDEEQKVMMIQEQVAMFLGVKSFKRRYPELQRRTISGEERDYVLSKGLVTEALCDLGITAVDASEVLDIMLSDYPHKYEEFRSHQRQRQLTEVVEEPVEEPKPEEKVTRVEMKPEKPVEQKPELPKVDPEKTRQDMAAAAIASAAEWNARANASRRGACADLQSLTVLRARPRVSPPARAHLRPPAGFYPHALLPGQYQHSYRVYTPEQLRYFPLNTVLAAPPPPPSVTEYSSDSEPDWGSRCSSSDDSDAPTHHSAKRKKLSKVKRSSQVEASTSSSGAARDEPRDEPADTCRACKLRLEANRKYTHERFLVCANCNAKLHPSCVDLSADTIRKCREYPWQCPECKTCCSCRQPADDDKMLFCDLCDRGFHIYCVGLDTVPSGRWHCVECAICKSCGARSPSGPAGAAGGAPGPPPAPATPAAPAPPADWHHQTRRGPGGHKVYSHSLCTPCARAYRIGRYCPLCERSFIGPKGTMQLVICKLCDRQLHQECVRASGAVVRVLDYTCGECRRGGITSRAAAVRLAPRTIATLFMAKRRFNKYAHRQYMESRLRELAAPEEGSNDAADAGDEPDGDTVDVPDVPEPPSDPAEPGDPDADPAPAAE